MPGENTTTTDSNQDFSVDFLWERTLIEGIGIAVDSSGRITSFDCS